MCNEYSALAFYYHMSDPLVSGLPVVRYWNPDIGHSFTSFGDDRARRTQSFVADGWTMNRDPQLFRNTIMHGGTNNTVAEWANRMPGEGNLYAQGRALQSDALFNQAELNPNVLAQRSMIWNANLVNQQNQLNSIRQTGQLPSGIYNYSSNRR